MSTVSCISHHLFLTRARYPYIVTDRGSALVFRCSMKRDDVIDDRSDNVNEISFKDKWFVCFVSWSCICLMLICTIGEAHSLATWVIA